MKNLCLILILSALIQSSSAQMAWITPVPTSATQWVTVYIDVSQSEMPSGTGLKHMLTEYPEQQDNVYFWFWQPNGPITGNGDWTNSAPEMHATWVSDMIYSMSFVPVNFFNADAEAFYSLGISFLAKLGDVGDEGKTEDLHIDINGLSVSEVKSTASITCYPNPIADELFIATSNFSNGMNISISDLSGRNLLQRSFSSQMMHSQPLRLDMQNFPNGLYLLTLSNETHVISEKILVE